MKEIYMQLSGALALTFTIAACVPAAAPPEPTPAPAPVATPAPAPPPVVQAPQYENYLDAPRTRGDWKYERSAGGPVAAFVTNEGNGVFLLTCDLPRGSVSLWRAGRSANRRALRIRTETLSRTIEVVQAEDTNPYLTATLSAGDPLLDAMAITRGHFAVETEGLPTLYMPAWPEISRVIEDCR